MGRRKRSENIAEVAVRPVPSVAPTRVAAEKVIAAICPICLLPGTKILCPNGYKDIANILLGDEVMGLSTQAVEATYSRTYRGKAIKLKPRYLPPVSLTADHSVLVATLHEVYASKAENYKAKTEIGQPYWKPASDIQPNLRSVRHGGGDCVVLPKFTGRKEVYLDIESFSRKRYLLPPVLRGQVPLTEELAEFLGWYVADGSSSKKEVVLYLNLYEPEKLSQLTELVRKLGYTHFLSQRTPGCCALHINSRVLGRFLKHWFGHNARDKRVPSFIMFAPVDLTRKFLEGYFAGDGYYRKNRREANTVSEELALGLQLLSFRSGLPLGIFNDTGNRTCFQGRIVNASRIRYCLSGPLGISKKRKYFEDNDFYYLPVVKKEIFDYEGQVFNLKTTEGIYLTPFVVHNCGRTIPEGRAVKIGYITVGRTPYFETIQWDENKPFGVVFEASGRGSFREWQHISPEDCPELFEQVKKRFLTALKEWTNKGWVSIPDVLEVLERKEGRKDGISL